MRLTAAPERKRKMTRHLSHALRISVAAFILAVPAAHAEAATYEYDVLCRVGTIAGDFKDQQTLRSPALAFPNQPIVLNVGDTVILNLLFDRVVQVFDFGTPTGERFSFSLDSTDPNVRPWTGTWSSSIEALGGKGDIWVGPFSMTFGGSGSGLAWGAVDVPVTTFHASLTGIRWTATITSATDGVLPLTLTSFTGVELTADAIKLSSKR